MSKLPKNTPFYLADSLGTYTKLIGKLLKGTAVLCAALMPGLDNPFLSCGEKV